MNGVERFDIPFRIGPIVVERDGDDIEIRFDNNFRARYDGQNRIVACVDAAYFGQITGLCGNFDGITENDLTTKQGESVPDDWRGWNRVGDSWKVDDPENPTFVVLNIYR